jgi:UDP:flavonoid glycosyltransferase YjiC (YdhE family)
MKVLIHSHFPAGHTYPMQAVAQALVAHGHSVSWLASADNEARVVAVGAVFIPTRAVAALDGPLIKANDTGLFDRAGTAMDRRLLAQVADYRDALAKFPADVLLVDVLPHGARALSELAEIPVYATLGVIPMYTSGLGAPAAVSGGTPPGSSTAWLVGAAKQLLERWLWTPLFVSPAINSQRRRLGLRHVPFGEALEDSSYSPYLHVQASSLELEFGQRPNTRVHDENTVFVGPLVTKAVADPSKLPPWWPSLSGKGEKVVGITQGTLAMDPTSLIIPAIQALQDDAELVLVVVSPYTAEIQAGVRGSERIFYAGWLPYDILLPRLSLLITNGGYGSITQALSHGVPLLCAGQSEDKKDTAARVTYSGVGIDLKTDSPAAHEVKEAAYTILNDGGYRARARRLGDELNMLGGADAAVDALEKLVHEYTTDVD